MHVWKLGVWWQGLHGGLVELSTAGLVVTWGSMWVLIGYLMMWGCKKRWWGGLSPFTKPYIKIYWYSSFECVWYIQLSDSTQEISYFLPSVMLTSWRDTQWVNMVLFWRYRFTSTARPQSIMSSSVKWRNGTGWGSNNKTLMWTNFYC